MAIKEKIVKSYTIDSHPNPDLCFQWIRENWHDLNEHGVQEVVDSLKAIATHFDLSLDYSISQVPDRGEFITLKGVFNIDDVVTLRDSEEGLTGVWSDWLVLSTAVDADSWSVETEVLKAIHDETEYRYSDDALREDCEANDYYFSESGKLA